MAIFGTNRPVATPLFIGYLIALSWLLTRLRFFKGAGLTKTQLILVYILKIAAGIFYGWLGIFYGTTANMTDTWFYHAGGLQEQQILLNDPAKFFGELVHDPYQNGRWKFLSTENSYWNDLKSNAITKSLAILNFLTGGYYMVNVLFYNLLGMVGLICYYRVLIDRYPTKKTAVGLGVILLPSVLFWTSGIHKEGLIFTALGAILYSVYFMLKQNKRSIRRLTMFLAGLQMILVFRNHLLLALLPALLLWYLLVRFQTNPFRLTLAMYAVFISLFFLSSFIDPRIDLPESVARKQQEFMKLKGKSSIEVDPLQPNAPGFLKNLPQTIDLAFTRPHPSNVRHLLSLAAFLEVIAWGGLLMLWLRFRDRNLTWGNQPIDFFLLAFSVSVMLLIGFSINNLGAIVRYRSVILLPLLLPLIAGIDWLRLRTFLQFK